MMRRISVVVVILSLLFLFTACGQTGFVEISSALNRTNEAKSMSFEMEVSGDFTIEGMDDTMPEGMTAEQMETMLNQMKVNYEGKMIKDSKDPAKIQSEMSFSFGMMGMNMESTMWQRTLDDGKTMESIVKNPQLPGMETPELQYTVTRMPMQQVSKETNDQFTKILNDFILKNAKDEKFIKKIEKKHYQIHVDKEKCTELMEDILETVIASSDTLSSTTGVNIEEQYETAKKILPMILGDGGIDIDIIIGDDGYISQQIIKIDINVDVAELSKAMEQEAPDAKGKIGMKLEMELTYTGFNNVDTISYPEVSEANATIIEQ